MLQQRFAAIKCLLCLLPVAVHPQTPITILQDKFATPCYTPNSDQGYCVEINQCDVLLNAILSGNNGTFDFVRKSRCGPTNEDQQHPRVCCGKYGGPILSTTPTAPSTTAPATTEQPQLSVLPKQCGIQDVVMDSRIVGGTKTRLGQYPWMVRLRHRNPEGRMTYSCSGFLISPKYVITAAHCVWSDALARLGPIFEVQLGEHDLSTEIDCDEVDNTRCAPPTQHIRVGRVMVHPGYQNKSLNRHNDIALLPLKKPAVYNSFVQPICLLNTPIMDSPLFELSGWGTTERAFQSNVKLTVAVRKADFKECMEKYQDIGVTLIESQLCAGGKKSQDSCSGDSGGPLMLYRNDVYYAAGVVSFGVGCGREGWPGVYTNIPNYVSWIESVMQRRMQKSIRSRSTSSGGRH